MKDDKAFGHLGQAFRSGPYMTDLKISYGDNSPFEVTYICVNCQGEMEEKNDHKNNPKLCDVYRVIQS